MREDICEGARSPPPRSVDMLPNLSGVILVREVHCNCPYSVGPRFGPMDGPFPCEQVFPVTLRPYRRSHRDPSPDRPPAPTGPNVLFRL